MWKHTFINQAHQEKWGGEKLKNKSLVVAGAGVILPVSVLHVQPTFQIPSCCTGLKIHAIQLYLASEVFLVVSLCLFPPTPLSVWENPTLQP